MGIAQKGFSSLLYRKLGTIFVSYLVFLLLIGLFGKGYSAVQSLTIILASSFVAIIIVMKYTMKLIFKSIDYYIVILIFLFQIGIGIVHFITYMDPVYFSSLPGINYGVNSLGQDIHIDFQIIAYKMSRIAEYKLAHGYFAINPIDASLKYYIISYMINDLFYLSDMYILNFISINILSVFYSGVLLALMVYKLYGPDSYKYSRKVFYLAILQPFAWIPSHSMRDVFGALLIVIAIVLIYGASKRFKPFAYIAAILLTFPHRAVYGLSVLMIIGLKLLMRLKGRATKIFVTIIMLMGVVVVMREGATFSYLGNVMRHYIQNSSFAFVKIIKVIIGPFPWSQYLGEQVSYIASLYSSIFIMQASFGMALVIAVLLNKKNIFANKEIKTYFLIVLIFAIPSFFSMGAHNIYLLPSMFLILPLLSRVPTKKILIIFISVTLVYIISSILYTALDFGGTGLLKVG